MQGKSGNSGVALIAALGAAAVILVFGFASLYMARTNNQIARNVNLHTQARLAAEGGLDLAITALKKGVTPPSTLELGDYAIAISLSNEGDLTVVTAKASGPQNSSYTGQVVLSSKATQDDYLPLLVSEGETDLSGSAKFQGGLWANAGWSFRTDDVTFATPTGSLLAHADSRVYAGKGLGDYTCSVSGTAADLYCQNGEPVKKRLIDPVSVPTPPYDAIGTWVAGLIATPTLPDSPQTSGPDFATLCPGDDEELSSLPALFGSPGEKEKGDDKDKEKKGDDDKPKMKEKSETLTITADNVADYNGKTTCAKSIVLDTRKGDFTVDGATLLATDHIVLEGPGVLTLKDSVVASREGKICSGGDDCEDDDHHMEGEKGEGDHHESSEAPLSLLKFEGNVTLYAPEAIDLKLKDVLVSAGSETILWAKGGSEEEKEKSDDDDKKHEHGMEKHGDDEESSHAGDIRIDLSGEGTFGVHGQLHLTASKGKVLLKDIKVADIESGAKLLAKAGKSIDLAFTGKSVVTIDGELHLTADDQVQIERAKGLVLASTAKLLAKAGHDVRIDLGGDSDLTAAGEIHLTAGEDVRFEEFKTLNIQSGAKLLAKAGKDAVFSFEGKGALTLDGEMGLLAEKDVTFNDLKTLSEDGGVFRAKAGEDIQLSGSDSVDLAQSTLWAGGKIDLRGKSGLTLSGASITAKGTLTLNDEASEPIRIACNSSSVETALVAKAMNLRGRLEGNDASSPACGFFWAGGNIEVDQLQQFKGTMLSEGNIDVTFAGGGATLTAINPDLELNSALVSMLVGRGDINLADFKLPSLPAYAVLSRK